MAAFRLVYILLLGFALFSGIGADLAAAQTAADSTRLDSLGVQCERSLPALTVTASRLPTSPSNAPAHITVLDSSTLHATGTSSLADALDAHTGLFVKRYGPSGLATPSLRGAGASQTTVLLDGQPITDPQIGHLDLSLLPTVLLQSVEVMHGPASPIHGSAGLGGALQLHTLRPTSSLQLRGTATAGAFGERGGSLFVSGPLSDNTSVVAAAQYETTDGDFPYTDEALFPPETVHRRNADRQQGSFFGRVTSTIGVHDLQLSGWITRAERGLPPISSTAPATERQNDTQVRLWAQDQLPLGDGRLTVQGLAQHTRNRYINGDLDQTGRTWITSLDVTTQQPVSDRWTAAGGLSGSRSWARHPSLDADAQQEHGAAFVEGTGRYSSLRLYPAARTDVYWTPKGDTRVAVSPRLGLNVAPISQWPALHVKAQAGRAFRMPTFNDRYWQPGGNPNLRPERSWGGDVGLRLDRPRGHAEVTAFGHWRRDQIVWQPTGNGYWSPSNVDRVRAIGIEAVAKRAWALSTDATLQTDLTYTFTDARNRTDPSASSYNEPLRYVPRSQLKPRATLAWGPAALAVQARYTSRRYITSDGSQFLDPFVLTNTTLRLEQSLGGVHTELALQIDNLFDIDYESVGGRPMPPRHARVRLLVSP